MQFAGNLDQGHKLTKDIRPEITEDFARIYRKGVLAIEQAINLEKKYSELCACGRRVTIPYPDVNALTNALKFLGEMGPGKAPTQAPKPVKDPRAAQKAVEAMTDEELAGELAEVVEA